jgi:hypothetical protein
MRHEDDSPIIFAGLAERFEELATYLYPGALRYKGALFPAAVSKVDRGSFEIIVSGPRAPSWFRNSGGVGGTPIQLLAYSMTADTVVTKEVFDEARRFLGIDRKPVSDEERSRRAEASRAAAARAEEARQRHEEEARLDAERRQENAAWIWDQGKELHGTPGELYMLNRGLILRAWPETLRFMPRLRHGSGEWSPAIVAKITDAQDRFLGIHRIYITPEGRKAFGKQSKLALGPIKGGTCRLFDPIRTDAGFEVGITEGIENAIAAFIVSGGGIAPWAGISKPGMIGFDVPFRIARVRILEDWDVQKRDQNTREWRPPPGQTAAAELSKRLAEEGVEAIREAPPKGGGDWNGLLQILQARGLYTQPADLRQSTWKRNAAAQPT